MSDKDCNHVCEGCSEENCASRQEIQKLNVLPDTKIKRIIAVLSGKGGVGKSLVTSLLAKELHEKGYKVGILDADITGPSIPKAFGALQMAEADEKGIYPVLSEKGIPLISVNSLLENHSDPIIWRGPLIAGLVSQLYSEVHYGELDFLLIDMPPGTGDIPLTVFQQIPVDGAFMVSTPQDLVSLIVEKSIKMTEAMNVPLLGMITNMAYVTCPDCGKKIRLYGEPSLALAKAHNIDSLDEIGIDPLLTMAIDAGSIEEYPTALLENATAKAISLLK